MAALRTSGKLICKGCVDKFVLPEMKDPFNNRKTKDKDIIHLKAPGVGFAGKAETADLVAKKVDVAFIG